MLATWPIAPALAAGNTVVLKPAEWTPHGIFLRRTYQAGRALRWRVQRRAGIRSRSWHGAGCTSRAQPNLLHRFGTDGQDHRTCGRRKPHPVQLRAGRKEPAHRARGCGYRARGIPRGIPSGGAIGQCGPGLPIGHAAARPQEHRRRIHRGLHPQGGIARSGQSAGSAQRHRPPGPSHSLRADHRLRKPCEGGWRDYSSRRRAEFSARRPLFSPDPRGKTDARQRDRDAGGLRTGAHHAGLRAHFGGSKKSGMGREGGTWSFDFYAHVKNTVLAPNGWRE